MKTIHSFIKFKIQMFLNYFCMRCSVSNDQQREREDKVDDENLQHGLRLSRFHAKVHRI